MTNGKGRPAYRRVAGAALMVLGAVLVGYGAHYLIQNGNCSSTGYASAGTVPRCGGGEGLSTLSVFVLGPALAVGGWWLGRLWGALWPATGIALGAGLITIGANPGVTAITKTFGLVAGACCLALALASVGRAVHKRLAARTTSAAVHLPPARPASPAGPGSTLVVPALQRPLEAMITADGGARPLVSRARRANADLGPHPSC
jgi:hypothetical protein